MNRIRVLLFGRYADAEFGGIERHVRTLAECLRDEVQFVNLVEGRGYAEDAPWPCPVHHSRAVATIASQPICPGMPFTAARLHRSYRFQLAHLHLPDPMSHVAAMALPNDMPVVLTWHSDIVKQRNLFALYRPFLKRLVARAHAVIAATPAHFTALPQLARLVPSEKRAVIPYGFDLARYKVPHPKSRELRERFGEQVVFALGRHVYYKGFEYLIGAMAHVPRARLVLGGSGPLTAQLKDLATRLGVAGRVLFTGRIPDDELPAYYQACDVFCLPSVETSEAFGIVQVEAMAAGKPVVCCDLGNGVNWVNQHARTGLAVQPRDEHGLAVALKQLLEDGDLRAKLGREAAKWAGTVFSITALRTETLATYRAALEKQ